jgi:tripartite-type tricarboxylate transporter receptor subunit TctC
MRKLIASALALIGLLAALGARAQDAYPSQNIRFVVPFTAGSATDTLARLLANRMSMTLGRSIFVENIAAGMAFRQRKTSCARHRMATPCS